MSPTRFFATRARQRVGVNALHLAALLALAVAPLHADTVLSVPTNTDSGVTIKLSSPSISPPRFGFAPIRVTIENAAAQERSWRVLFQVGQRGQFPGVVNTERAITVPAGQTRETWVFVPLAEPSTSAGSIVTPGSPAAMGGGPSGPPAANVMITKTLTGTKITRTILNPSTGAPIATEEVELNATTGERKSATTSGAGGSSTSSNSSTPPANLNVTYVINPITGMVSTNFASGRGAGLAGALAAGPHVNIITSTNPAAGSPSRAGALSGSMPTKVTITQTPVGTKVARVTTIGRSGVTFSQEQEIDATTGVMTSTTIPPPGATAAPPRMSTPPPPGTETTFTIDQATGNIRTNTRSLPDRTAPPKVTIITAPALGAGGGGALISSTGPAVPFVVGGTTNPTVINVEVFGPGVTTGRRVTFGAPSGMQMRPFAVSPATEQTVRGQLSAIVRGAPNLSTVEPAQLPADWRVWSPFAGAILTVDEFATLDAGRRAALRGWVGLGGRLWLSPSVAGREHVEKIGAGVITTLAEPLSAMVLDSGTVALALQAARDELVNLQRRYREPHPLVTEQRAKIAALEAQLSAGAGGKGAPAAAPAALAAAVAAAGAAASPGRAPFDFWINTIQIYGGTPGLPDRDAFILEKTPLGEAAQERATDMTWLAMFLVAFAAIIGPVNLFMFAPAARRHRLFLTTPLIALAAALVLATAILMQDGLGGDGVRRALVVLLPGENQAAVFQEQTALTGFLTHRSFPLAGDTQLTMLPLDIDQRTLTMTMANSSELVRDDSQASGDWFRSRGRQAHLLQRLVPTRGRIERVGAGPGGAPIVQSSLGTALRDFVCVDDTGRFWTIAELPPGKRVTLARGTSAAGPLTLGGSHRFGDVLEAATPKTAGHWHAKGGATDLAPIATLETVRWQEADVIFAGVLEGAPAEKKTEARP